MYSRIGTIKFYLDLSSKKNGNLKIWSSKNFNNEKINLLKDLKDLNLVQNKR